MASALRTETLVVGGGLTGIVATLELLSAGRQVMLVDRGEESQLGGLALQAFGGMALVDTPLQRLSGIRDSAELALQDWLGFAHFGPEDVWPRRWAEHYVSRCVPEVYDWLKTWGLRFIPAVQWVERGLMKPGNSVPRYHVLWGTSRHMTLTLLQALWRHPRRAALTVRSRCRVTALSRQGARIQGCEAVDERTGQPLSIEAEQVLIAAGGITGDLSRVRRHWPADWGVAPPDTLLNGSHPWADGSLHDATRAVGGQVTHLDWMWNYAAGVRHPHAQFEGHGLSLIPAKSGLWLDPLGRRIGPMPLVTGFDTREMVAQIARAAWPHTWQVLNRRIAERELAASGAEHNPLIRDRRALAFAWQMLRGNASLIDELLAHCPDVVQAPTLESLAERMNAIAGPAGPQVDAQTLAQEIAPYDAQIRRGPRFHNDEQLRRIAQLRRWLGDRMRTCDPAPLLDPAAGPLIAIRCQLLTRKSMGGIQTDLDSRVLDAGGQAIEGLYAAGEAAGFGGGGANGEGSLEGTFLSGCILTARAAARHMARQGGHVR
ncbi:MAG TPA: FAD-binding dehydrogenase [Aquabacterium sp.]|uniref:FAD-binding dehydrogenase n=1 Tax=Aquabacterium sp. TaxID=1872578 RepID=UPI002E3665A6|nr:FAD-binding dehydrogenase [Aquabacterium sp.]HEX5373767.1 FAD-binding dehydrogenase [Aquabacterium sp.]